MRAILWHRNIFPERTEEQSIHIESCMESVFKLRAFSFYCLFNQGVADLELKRIPPPHTFLWKSNVHQVDINKRGTPPIRHEVSICALWDRKHFAQSKRKMTEYSLSHTANRKKGNLKNQTLLSWEYFTTVFLSICNKNVKEYFQCNLQLLECILSKSKDLTSNPADSLHVPGTVLFYRWKVTSIHL